MKSSLSEHCIFEQNSYFPGWLIRGTWQVKKMTRYLRALTLPQSEHLLFSRKARILQLRFTARARDQPPSQKESSFTFHIQTIGLIVEYWHFKFIDVGNLSLVYTMTLCSSSAQSQGHWRSWAHKQLLVLLMPVFYVLFSLSGVDFDTLSEPKWGKTKMQDFSFYVCFVLFFTFLRFLVTNF